MFLKLVHQPQTEAAFRSFVSDLFGDEQSVPHLQSWAKIPVDIQEHADRYEIVAELPGVKKEDLHVGLDKGVLSITGKRMPLAEGSKGRLVHSEIPTGAFERTFSIPRDVDAAKLDAQLSHGILTLIMPKAETSLPREIAVK
jgi:HSP20 family protein